MKQFILLLLFFAVKSLTSQNGLATYSVVVPTGTTVSQETVIFIDNVGNKWVGFTGGGSSAAAFAKYDNTTSSWAFWNLTTMALSSTSVSNNVKAFAQDNAGNIWIGTTNGLIKYDGTNFTVYNTTNGLPNNMINCLEFNNNMLYIGTQGGLSRYDGTIFTNYSLLPLISIQGIKAETPTTIWVTGGVSLIKLSFNSSYTSSSYITAVTTSTSVPLKSIYIDASGNKWICSTNQIVKYDNTNLIYLETMYPDFTGADFYGANSICKGPNNGVLFIGTYMGTTSGSRCLVELLSGGKTKLYNFPSNTLIGSALACDPSGKIFTTGAVTSSTTTGISVKIHSFDYSNYSIYGAFGLGAGGGVNSDNFKYLDINRVKAGIMNRGDMWWGNGGTGGPSYEVPKSAIPLYGVHSAFGGGLWIGGLDASNQLHIAAQTYRQDGNDFWPGPLDTTTAFIDTVTAVNYDKIWKVSTDDINTFLYQFSLGNVPLTYTPTPDILSWPAKGTGAKSRNLAPFVDANNNGIYDPLVGGDYPKIKGDQTLYFIFNDNLGSHSQTGGLPLGIEVHAMAYAYSCPSVLNGRTELAYTTFYDYKIYNRSNYSYHDVSAGFWINVELGGYYDDYIGCSVNENLGFCYNADDNDDNTAGSSGYELFPPAIGTTVLKGPLAPLNDLVDNDNDSIVDEIGEECLMNVFDYIRLQSMGPSYDIFFPKNKYQYYNYLQAKWQDSSNFTCGGNAYGGSIPTKFVYPWNNYLGNTCSSGWDELSAGNLAGFRRYIISSGPSDFPAKSMTEFEFAQVWSVDSSATSNINIASVNKLISDTRKIRSFYKSGGANCVGKAIGIKETELKEQLLIYPNPANSTLNIKSENSLGKSTIAITDILGKTIIETKSNDFYQTSINIEQLSGGVYLLQLKSEKGVIVKKFVKE